MCYFNNELQHFADNAVHANFWVISGHVLNHSSKEIVNSQIGLVCVCVCARTCVHTCLCVLVCVYVSVSVQRKKREEVVITFCKSNENHAVQLRCIGHSLCVE